jgi:hypothetical protein
MDDPQEITDLVVTRIQDLAKQLFCKDCCKSWELGMNSLFTVSLPQRLAALVMSPTLADDGETFDDIYLDVKNALEVLGDDVELRQYHYDHNDSRLDINWLETFGGIEFQCHIALLMRAASEAECKAIVGQPEDGPDLEVDDHNDTANEVICDMLAIAGYKAIPAVVARWTMKEKSQALNWAQDAVLAEYSNFEGSKEIPAVVKPLPKAF